jgi:hypothetical protein
MDCDEIWYGYYATGGYPELVLLASYNLVNQHNIYVHANWGTIIPTNIGSNNDV